MESQGPQNPEFRNYPENCNPWLSNMLNWSKYKNRLRVVYLVVFSLLFFVCVCVCVGGGRGLVFFFVAETL